MKPETLAVHAGRATEPGTGAVTPSITLSTTFEREVAGGYTDGHSYTRSGNPNRRALETAFALLEGGKEAFAFASGMAATSAVLHTLSAGDHVILPDDLYHGTRDLVRHVLHRWGLQATFLDMQATDRVAEALRPNTRLVWAETPSNPSLKMVDLAALAVVAHAGKALLAVDNTWATPLLQRPLDWGADVVMHSTTKYFGGHSDVLGGCVVVSPGADPDLADRLRSVQKLAGGVPSPFDCWLLLRSLPTMPCRVRTQSESAAQIAAFLAGHPRVAAVYYPGLPTHPGHGVARRQMSGGFGGMLSFLVHGGAAAALGVTHRVKLITRATSLGGVESLIEHRASVEGPDSPTPANLLRFSTGLEHPEDLIADLEQALDG
jgi:cystathionine gamma-synthase